MKAFCGSIMAAPKILSRTRGCIIADGMNRSVFFTICFNIHALVRLLPDDHHLDSLSVRILAVDLIFLWFFYSQLVKSVKRN